jgi:hypothetical protein
MITDFRVVTLSNLIYAYRRFEGSACISVQIQASSTQKTEATAFLKCWYPSTKQYGLTSQKTVIFIPAGTTTSNLSRVFFNC